VNIVEKGKNYGWSAYEGTKTNNDELAKKLEGTVVFPIYEYDRTGREIAAIIGGCTFTHLKKIYYLFADLSGSISIIGEKENGKWTLRANDTVIKDRYIKGICCDSKQRFYCLTSKLLGLDTVNYSGAIYRLDLQH